MNITKLPSGHYRLRKTIRGKMYSVTLDHKPTKAEAEEILADLTRDRYSATNRRMTFQEAAEGYFSLKSNILSPTTMRAYKSYLKNMDDRFKSLLLEDIDQIAVQQYINDITPNYSSKSVHNIHGFISAVLSVYKPTLKLSTHLPPKARFEAHTPSEMYVDKIVEANKGTKYDIAFRLACYGLRRSEICALTDADLIGDNKLRINKAYIFDGEQWLTRMYNKTYGSTRDIFIDSDLTELIRQTDGKLYKGSPKMLLQRLTSLLDRYEMEHFRFHDLRAFFVSYAHALGIPDVYIMAQGGWSSSYVMQSVYRRALEDKKDEEMAKFADSLFNAD